MQCGSGRITAIHIDSQDLPGKGGIPQQFFELVGLEVLSLYQNNLYGSVPPALGQLTQLHSLNLDDNAITALPASIGQLQQLTRLQLDNNALTALPEEIGQLQRLTTFAANSNQIAGSFPIALTKLMKLINLGIGSNALSGRIPAAIAQQQQLGGLQLFGNQFTGPVPEELTHIKGLISITLELNPHLTGVLPSFNFSQFKAPGGCCAMYGVNFTCPLPAGAGSCTGGQMSACSKLPPPTCVQRT